MKYIIAFIYFITIVNVINGAINRDAYSISVAVFDWLIADSLCRKVRDKD